MLERDEQIKAVIKRWPFPKRLSTFARKRHGYSNTDCGCGVTYPEDLDEYDKKVDRIFIPKACVQIYGFFGAARPNGYEFVVSEKHYLAILLAYLQDENLHVHAKEVEEMLNRDL